MGLLKLVGSFSLIWIGLFFIIFGFNVFMIFNLPPGSVQFYVGMVELLVGLLLIVIGACYVVGEFVE